MKTGNPYQIKIERGLAQRAGAEIRQVPALRKAKKAAVVTDSNLEGQARGVAASLKAAGYGDVMVHVFPPGRKAKSFLCRRYAGSLRPVRPDPHRFCRGLRRRRHRGHGGLCRRLLSAGRPLCPDSHLPAGPGGFLRGRKNRGRPAPGQKPGGRFWQPSLVLIDPDTLDTLPARYFADGMGEVIKYGCIRSRALFDSLKDGNARERIEDIIFQCVDIKRQVVENDERDKGERMILNFGHTLGHSLKKSPPFPGPFPRGGGRRRHGADHPGFGGRGLYPKREPPMSSVLSCGPTACRFPTAFPTRPPPRALSTIKILKRQLEPNLAESIGQCAVVPIGQRDLLPFLEGEALYLIREVSVPGKSLAGTITLPPSKSAAHRAVLCASLAKGFPIFLTLVFPRDMQATCRAAEALGVKTRLAGNTLIVDSRGLFSPEQAVLDCGESGSTLRFLIPIAAAGGVCAEFTGKGRLPQRPIGVYLDCLPNAGVSCQTEGGLPRKSAERCGRAFSLCRAISVPSLSPACCWPCRCLGTAKSF